MLVNASSSITNVRVRANIETSVSVVNYDSFVSNYNAKLSKNAVILQGHAGAWNDDSREEFKKILEFLKGKNQWICYDLGEESPVSKASVLWNKADRRKARFKIEISDDNESFNTLFDGEACGTMTTFEDFEIKGSGRYIRIYCMGNSESSWNAIKEIIIYK